MALLVNQRASQSAAASIFLQHATTQELAATAEALAAAAATAEALAAAAAERPAAPGAQCTVPNLLPVQYLIYYQYSTGGASSSVYY
jgi:hypothetical protein